MRMSRGILCVAIFGIAICLYPFVLTSARTSMDLSTWNILWPAALIGSLGFLAWCSVYAAARTNDSAQSLPPRIIGAIGFWLIRFVAGFPLAFLATAFIFGLFLVCDAFLLGPIYEKRWQSPREIRLVCSVSAGLMGAELTVFLSCWAGVILAPRSNKAYLVVLWALLASGVAAVVGGVCTAIVGTMYDIVTGDDELIACALISVFASNFGAMVMRLAACRREE